MTDAKSPATLRPVRQRFRLRLLPVRVQHQRAIPCWLDRCCTVSILVSRAPWLYRRESAFGRPPCVFVPVECAHARLSSRESAAPVRNRLSQPVDYCAPFLSEPSAENIQEKENCTWRRPCS